MGDLSSVGQPRNDVPCAVPHILMAGGFIRSKKIAISLLREYPHMIDSLGDLRDNNVVLCNLVVPVPAPPMIALSLCSLSRYAFLAYICPN